MNRGSRWSKVWTHSVRDNEQLSHHARWIVNDLLDDIVQTQGKIAATDAKRRGKTGLSQNCWSRRVLVK